MEITVESSLDEMFNAFVADEMWAALSYKNAAFVSKGKALKYANGIFNDNSDEEFEHMEELVDMAKSLGIVVSFDLEDMQENCTTPYGPLNPDEDTKRLVEMFIDAEKRAIEGYETALKSEAVKEKPELCQFFGEICNDEHKHLAELEDCYSNVAHEGDRLSDMDDADAAPAADDTDDTDDEEDSEQSDAGRFFGKTEPPASAADDDEDEDEDEEEDDDAEDEDDSEDDDDENAENVSESFAAPQHISIVGFYRSAFGAVNG